MCDVRRFTPSGHMRCKNKCPLRARGGQQCQHKESYGLRSPASAALRMRVATSILLDCDCCPGDNELQAESSATCMFLTVSGLKCPASVMNVPKEELCAISLETSDAQHRLSCMHY